MVWSNPRTWVAGEAPSAATLNTHIRDNLNFLYDSPSVYIWVTAATTSHTTSGSWQALTGFTEDNDTDSMHATSTDYLLVNTTGRYQVIAQVRFNQNATGLRGVRVAKSTDNGSTWPTIVTNNLVGTGSGANDCGALATNEVDLVSGDRVRLEGNQYSGAALNMVGGDRAYSFLSLRFVSP